MTGRPYVPGPRDGYCAGGCAGPHRPGRLMCPTCWTKVPAELRREVLSTWWAVWTTTHARGSACARRHELRALRNAHRRARRHALASAQGAGPRLSDVAVDEILNAVRRSA